MRLNKTRAEGGGKSENPNEDNTPNSSKVIIE